MREKEEEEAAKEINQRFHKRLGLSRPINSPPHHHHPRTKVEVEPPSPVSTPAATPTRKAEEEPREEEPQELGASGPIYSPPLLDADLNSGPALEPPKPSDLVTLASSSDVPLYPSALVGEVSNGQPAVGNDLDSTVQETPPIVMSRTYSLTEQISRTTIVPVFDGSSTTNHTVTESFEIRKLITAYRTVPSGDQLLLQTASAEMNNASYMIDAIEASESNLDSQNGPGAVNNQVEPTILGGYIQTISPDNSLNAHTPLFMPAQNGLQSLEPSLGFGSAHSMNIPSLDLNNPLVVGAALRNPAFAAMYLGLQNLQQQNNQPKYETITKPVEVVTTETLYNTKVLSFYDGRSSRARIITEPTAKIAKTITTLATQVTPKLNTELLIQQAQMQRALASQLMNTAVINNPLDMNNYNRFSGDFGGNQANFHGYVPAIFNASLNHAFGRGFNTGLSQQFNGNNNYNPGLNMALNQAFNPKQIVITHTYTTLTSVTSTDTKVYTLKYNALSTKYRTVTSTSVYPTVITTTSLSTIGQTQAQFNPFFG